MSLFEQKSNGRECPDLRLVAFNYPAVDAERCRGFMPWAYRWSPFYGERGVARCLIPISASDLRRPFVGYPKHGPSSGGNWGRSVNWSIRCTAVEGAVVPEHLNLKAKLATVSRGTMSQGAVLIFGASFAAITTWVSSYVKPSLHAEDKKVPQFRPV